MFKTHGFQLPTVFNPANLFPGGFAGFYGDPSVFANNFTTSAGSTNATAAGDPLGRIVRLAGSLNLTQGTDAARPTLARSPRSGLWQLFTTGTATFTTRTFATRAVEYTLSAEGDVGATITLSGTSTAGPLTCTGAGNRVSLTFTPTAGTLTLTVSGTVNNGQIVFGASALPYQNVGAGAWDVTQPGQPDIWLPWFDGSNDYLTTGVQSFGTASLFADAGQQWTVFGVLITLTTSARILGKSGTTAGNATLRIATNSTTGRITTTIRGVGSGANVNTTSVTDGGFHTWLLRWNGLVADIWVDGVYGGQPTVGSAVEEAQNITISAQNESSPSAFFAGRNLVDMIDRALTDTEVAQLMAYLNSTYRYGL